MTMFGPWYDPHDDPSVPPWPGFDPQRIVASFRPAVVVVVSVLLALVTFAIMRSVAP